MSDNEPIAPTERRARPSPYVNAPCLPAGDRVALPSLFEQQSGPIAIEIGPGRGAFALEWLAARPEGRLLALEVRRKWAQILDERMTARGLRGRARSLAEDAREALVRLGPDASVAYVFMHFPDPWWKKRHQKRMVMGDTLLEHAVRLLAPGGEFCIQTDVPTRAIEYEMRLAAHPALMPGGDVAGSARLAANPYGARSNREKRADEDGLPVVRLRFRRR